MTSPFRLAFLGIDNPHGAGWRDLLLNFGDEVQLTAIMPGFGGATASLEERHAHLPRFESVDALLAGAEFDGAVVALPNNEGPQAVAKLARAGKHVLAEKPVCGSAADARQIVDAVRESSVAFQAGYMWRYDEGATRLREMLADGRFGKLISLEMLFVTSDVNRRGPSHYLFNREASTGGFLNWLGCHQLDLLFYVTRQKVVGVTARTGVFGGVPVEVEDGGVAILDLDGGGIATFLGGYWLPRWAGESEWRIRGTERWVRWEPGRRGTNGVFEIHGPQPQWYAMEETFTMPPDEVPGYGGKRGVALVCDWLDAAREGGRACRNTPQSICDTLELIDTIYRSSAEGRRIECSIGA
jgi:predicted dehydrogenase